MSQSGIEPRDESSDSELEDPGLPHLRPSSPQPGPSGAVPPPPSQSRKRKRGSTQRRRAPPPTRDQSTSTSDLTSGYHWPPTNSMGTQTTPAPGESDSDSDSVSSLSTLTSPRQPTLSELVASVAENTDAPPSHPPDGEEVSPVPGPSNWVPPGVVEGNTVRDQLDWHWYYSASLDNPIVPRQRMATTSLSRIIGHSEEPISTPDLDQFVDNWSDPGQTQHGATNQDTDSELNSDFVPDYSDVDSDDSEASRFTACPSDCSSLKENTSPRVWLSPTPPHSEDSDLEQPETDEPFNLQLNLED